MAHARVGRLSLWGEAVNRVTRWEDWPIRDRNLGCDAGVSVRKRAPPRVPHEAT